MEFKEQNTIFGSTFNNTIFNLNQNDLILMVHYKLFIWFLSFTLECQYSEELSSVLSQGVNTDKGRQAKSKLSQLSQGQACELSTDLFEELGRRSFPSSTSMPEVGLNQMSCLAAVDSYNPIRNQSRRKLSEIPDQRLKDLVVDLTQEIGRRLSHSFNRTTLINEKYFEESIVTDDEESDFRDSVTTVCSSGGDGEDDHLHSEKTFIYKRYSEQSSHIMQDDLAEHFSAFISKREQLLNMLTVFINLLCFLMFWLLLTLFAGFNICERNQEDKFQEMVEEEMAIDSTNYRRHASPSSGRDLNIQS